MQIGKSLSSRLCVQNRMKWRDRALDYVLKLMGYENAYRSTTRCPLDNFENNMKNGK